MGSNGNRHLGWKQMQGGEGGPPSYPAVDVVIEDLRRQRVAVGRPLVTRDVAVHPQPLLLQHGDVYLLEVDSVGLQEAHHRLLLLFHLPRDTAAAAPPYTRRAPFTCHRPTR